MRTTRRSGIHNYAPGKTRPARHALGNSECAHQDRGDRVAVRYRPPRRPQLVSGGAAWLTVSEVARQLREFVRRCCRLPKLDRDTGRDVGAEQRWSAMPFVL